MSVWMQSDVNEWVHARGICICSLLSTFQPLVVFHTGRQSISRGQPLDSAAWISSGPSPTDTDSQRKIAGMPTCWKPSESWKSNKVSRHQVKL